MSTPTLDEARDRIDEIDRKVVELLAERLSVVDDLCEVKAEADRTVRDPERENELLDHVRSVAADAGLSPELAHRIYEEVLSHSVRRQRRQREAAAVPADDPA